MSAELIEAKKIDTKNRLAAKWKRAADHMKLTLIGFDVKPKAVKVTLQVGRAEAAIAFTKKIKGGFDYGLNIVIKTGNGTQYTVFKKFPMGEVNTMDPQEILNIPEVKNEINATRKLKGEDRKPSKTKMTDVSRTGKNKYRYAESIEDIANDFSPEVRAAAAIAQKESDDLGVDVFRLAGIVADELFDSGLEADALELLAIMAEHDGKVRAGTSGERRTVTARTKWNAKGKNGVKPVSILYRAFRAAIPKSKGGNASLWYACAFSVLCAKVPGAAYCSRGKGGYNAKRIMKKLGQNPAIAKAIKDATALAKKKK